MHAAMGLKKGLGVSDRVRLLRWLQVSPPQVPSLPKLPSTPSPPSLPRPPALPTPPSVPSTPPPVQAEKPKVNSASLQHYPIGMSSTFWDS